MRKIIALLLMAAMLLGIVPAMAEEDAGLALVRSAAQQELDEMRLDEDLGGWSQLILEHAQITNVVLERKTYTVTVTVPTLKSGASGSVNDGAAAYLQRAFEPYLTGEPTTELTLTATLREGEDGSLSVKWGNYTPKKLLNKVQNLANKARQSYTTNNVRIALDRYLLPDAAEMPKSKPKETIPAVDGLAEYTSAVAQMLGLTEAQAAQRLPALMMLMNIQSFKADDTLNAGVVTVNIKNWAGMLEDACTLAKEKMAQMVGIPAMSRLEIESILCQQLPAALVDAYYSNKGKTTEKLTINLAAAVGEGVQAADGMMDYFRIYNVEVERHLDDLMAYAATLAYYPRVELIDTGILAGADVAGGTSVSFDMGDGVVNHGYICIMRNGAMVLEGFVHNGVRLLVRLEPGDYQVYCNIGPEWFGTEHLFGKDGYFGVFDLTVERGSKSMIHMEDVDGNLPVTDLTEAEFHAAIGH